MLEKNNYQLQFVEYGSLKYQQAARLRYRLFYQEHDSIQEVLLYICVNSISTYD